MTMEKFVSVFILFGVILQISTVSSRREQISLNSRALDGSKMYVGDTKHTQMDENNILRPIPVQLDGRVVIYLQEYQLVTVKKGRFSVFDLNMKNVTITGVQVTFEKLFDRWFRPLFVLASEDEYLMDRILNTL